MTERRRTEDLIEYGEVMIKFALMLVGIGLGASAALLMMVITFKIAVRLV